MDLILQLISEHFFAIATLLLTLLTLILGYFVYRLQKQSTKPQTPSVTISSQLTNQSCWYALSLEIHNREKRALDLLEISILKPGKMRLLSSEAAQDQAEKPWLARLLKNPLPVSETAKSVLINQQIQSIDRARGSTKSLYIGVYAHCPPRTLLRSSPISLRLVFRWRDQQAKRFSVRAKVLPPALSAKQ